MIQTMRRSLGEHLEHAYYSLLRETVTRLVPSAVRFDEQDPILNPPFAPGAGGN